MAILRNNFLERVITRLAVDAVARDLRAVIRKSRVAFTINTPAQAHKAAALHRDVYDRLDRNSDRYGSHHTATHEVLRRKANTCLSHLTECLVDAMENPNLQKQCLLEMASLPSPADTAGNEDVVFEFDPNVSAYEPCVRFYRPPVLASRASHGYSRVVACTPRWVHTVMYSQIMVGVTATCVPPAVGAPLPKPPTDVLWCAVRLWSDTSLGVYSDFSAALAAAQLLV